MSRLNIRCILFTGFLFVSLSGVNDSVAQKTLSNEEVIKYYNRGLDLYDKEKYGSAIKEFQTFISKSDDRLLNSMARYYWGASAIELNNPEGLAILQKYMHDFPESHRVSEANFKIANYYLRRKEYRQALSHFKETEPELLTPTDADAAYFGRGYTYYQTDKFTEAKNSLQPLLKKEKGKFYTQSNYYHGYMNYKENNYEEALINFERIRNREIKIVKLYIAQIHYAQGHYSRVIEFADSLNFEPAKKPGRFLIGKAYYQLTEYGKAYPYMQEMASHTDSLLSTEIYQIAYTIYQNKKYEDAYLVFSKIASANSAVGQMASYNMAACFLELNKKSSARNAFYQASRTDFDKKVQEVSAFNYSKLSFELTYQQEALASLQLFIANYPESQFNDDAKGLLAELLLSTKNYKDAVLVLESITKMNDQTKSAYQKITYYRGEELYLNKEFDKAYSCFTKALKYTPDKMLQALSHFWTGEIHYKNVALTSAIDSYNKFLDFSESGKTRFKSMAYYNLGYCYFKMREFPNALNYFNKFVELGNERQDIYVDAQLRLADCYFTGRDYKKALDVYSYVTSKSIQGSDYAHFQRATIYGLTGEYTEKIAELKKITEKYPNSIFVDLAIYELAVVHQQLELYPDAIRYFNYLIADYNGSIYIKNAWERLGLVYLAMKDEEKAISSFKKVIELFPETKEADEAVTAITEIYTERGEAAEVFAYLKSRNRLSLSALEQDSIMYFYAYNRYNQVPCSSSVTDFTKYLDNFGGGRHSIKAHFYRAECEYKLKNHDKALIDYQYIVNQIPNEFAERAAKITAVIYYGKKDYNSALPYYVMLENISKNKESYQTAVIGQMKSLLKLSRIEEAYQAAIKVLRSDYTNKDVLAEAHFIMGTYDVSRNANDSALTHFRYVVKESKNALGAESAYHIALIQYIKNNYDEAEKTILSIKDNYSGYSYWVAKSYILMSDVFLKKGDDFNARAILQRLVDKYDNDEDDIKKTAREKLGQIN